MINVIVELSKYVILTLMVIYTFHCFYLVKQQSEEERNESLRQQLMLIFFMDFTAFLVIYLKTGKFQVVLFYVEMMAFFAVIQILYRIFYKKASILLLNNMCMLLSVGFIMLCRLDVSTATRQLMIVAGVNVVALIVPVLIRKMKFLKDLTWIYAGIGIILLAAVFVLAKTSYGAKLSLMGIQPSEAIKITFVFFMAALLLSLIHICVAKCPKHLIELVPYEQTTFVQCSSHAKGKAVTSACEVGCIGCKKCEKTCPNGAITIDNFCAHIDYSKCTNCGACKEVCPRHIIQ